MNADQIAEIRPAIREAIDGAPDTCVTLEAHGDPGKWMQVTDRTINAAYPHEDHPQERLTALPAMAGLQITNWAAGKFPTFSFPHTALTPPPYCFVPFFL